MMKNVGWSSGHISAHFRGFAARPFKNMEVSARVETTKKAQEDSLSSCSNPALGEAFRSFVLKP